MRTRVRQASRRALDRAFGPARSHARHPERLRGVVGGLWDEMGRIQLEYIKGEGLEPHHDFLDVGCGVLRGGIPLIRYLEPNRYCGIDHSPAMLAAAEVELGWAGLEDRGASLVLSGSFEFERFGRQFDYALAQSVFTHIPMNSISVCLQRVQSALKPGGRFYATFLEAPEGMRSLEVVEHDRVDGPPTRSCPDADPYHYSVEDFEWLAERTELELSYIGDWGSPRSQRMLLFRRP